jgi:PIN domain nuclease of toxin-antitoxin system
VNLLLDTHILVWAVTVWPSPSGFRRRSVSFYQDLAESDFVELPITAAHALSVSLLPRLHKDPFDRLILAQTNAEGLTLLTNDATLAQYPGQVTLV